MNNRLTDATMGTAIAVAAAGTGVALGAWGSGAVKACSNMRAGASGNSPDC